MLRRRTLALTTAALIVAASSLAACEPTPPPPAFVVTVTTDEGDADPGDGVCASTASSGACTLRAAIEEGNALGRADITLTVGPIVQAQGAPPWTVTGGLTMTMISTGSAAIGGHFVVEADASLVATRALLGFSRLPIAAYNVTFAVHGVLLLDRSLVNSVTVSESGVLLSQNTGIGNLTNDGTAHLRHVLSFGVGGTVAGIHTGPTGATHVASSVIRSQSTAPPTQPLCTGTPLVSGGHNLAADASCGLTATGDLESVAFTDSFVPALGGLPEPIGLAVDHVPAGVNGCGTEVTGDHLGRPRPVDGGSGTASCDAGPLEKPAA